MRITPTRRAASGSRTGSSNARSPRNNTRSRSARHRLARLAFSQGALSLLVALCAAILLASASGCSAPDPYGGAEFRRAVATPALPYVALVHPVRWIDSASGDVHTIGATSFPPQEEPETGVLPHEIQEALERYNVFAFVASDASELASRGLRPELEIEVAIKRARNFDDFLHTTTGMKWANLFLWLFAGAPGWIIEDTYVDPGVTAVSCRVWQSGETEQDLLHFDLDLAGVNKLNFVRRAGVLEYLTQVVVPPFLVTSDPETASEALWQNYVSRIQSSVPRTIKESFVRSLVGTAPQLLVISPRRTGDSPAARPSDLDVLIFADEVPGRLTIEAVRGSEEKVLRRELASVEFDPSPRDEWKPLAEAVIGEDAEFLEAYRYKLRAVAGGLLANILPGKSTYLRLTADFPSERRIVERSWTVEY